MLPRAYFFISKIWEITTKLIFLNFILEKANSTKIIINRKYCHYMIIEERISYGASN